MFCPNCGSVIQPTALFCVSCGARKVGSSSSTSKPTVSNSGDMRIVFRVTFWIAVAATAIGLLARQFENYDMGGALDSLSTLANFGAKVLLIIAFIRRHYELMKWGVFILAASLLLDISGFSTDFYLYQIEELGYVGLIVSYFVEASRAGIRPFASNRK